MKILLINNNPVVSRLTALSARKENVEIDEIEEITELNSDGYDMVFVDAESLTKDVHDIIKEHLKVKKSILFYTEGEEENKDTFDLTILKPFLPSEVSAVIRLVEEMEEPKEEEKHFDILNEAKETDKKEDLFTLNELVELKEEPFESKTEDSFDKRLEEAFPLNINTLDDELFEEKKEEKETIVKDKTPKDEELFKLDIGDNKVSLEDEILDFNKERLKFDEIDNEEIFSKVEEESVMVLEEDKEKIEEVIEKKKVEVEEKEEVLETKILDKNEIANIKGLLSEDINTNEMTLEELMTPPMIVTESKDKENKTEKPEKIEKEEIETEKEKEPLSVSSDVLVQSLTSLSIEGLRELLAGARVNINIKFPKAK